jgi:hypothetical protein
LGLRDRSRLDSPALGIELASALQRLHPASFRLDGTLGMIGARSVVAAIARGDDPRAITAGWEADIAAFRERRAPYLLYR